jgi:hypothetical protein
MSQTEDKKIKEEKPKVDKAALEASIKQKETAKNTNQIVKK